MQLFLRGGGFSFGRAQFHGRDQPAQILIAGAIFDQQRIEIAVLAGDFGADVRLGADLFRSHVEARRAAEIVAIHQRHGGVAQVGGALDQILGQRSGFEETEGRASVEVDKTGLVINAFHEPLRRVRDPDKCGTARRRSEPDRIRRDSNCLDRHQSPLDRQGPAICRILPWNIRVHRRSEVTRASSGGRKYRNGRLDRPLVGRAKPGRCVSNSSG